MNKAQAKTQDQKIQEEIHRWTAGMMVLNSAVRLLSVLALSACFLNLKKGALKCKEIPSHSRLRMNSSRSGDEVMLNYELIWLLLKSELMDSNL